MVRKVRVGNRCPWCRQGMVRLTAGQHGTFLGCTEWRPDGAGCNAVWLTDGSRLPHRFGRDTYRMPVFASTSRSRSRLLGRRWWKLGVFVGLAWIAAFVILFLVGLVRAFIDLAG